ncbi:MAG: putative MPP superfamily phosphohydrolase [Gammaproteobacteria bacterium]|jgi:predicted MPP superfamily phosphohydrolase
MVLAIWSLCIEPGSLKIVEHHLRLPDWPKACAGLKLAVLADLHVGSPFNGIDKLREIVELTNRSKPDLVLLPGDFVIDGVLGGDFVPPETAANVLGKIEASAGIFAVLGNHDWWLDPSRVERALADANISVMEDRSQKITHGACSFFLVGVSDFTEGPHDLEKALSEVTASDSTLLFTHNPDVFPEIPDHIELTIAGHTHGGQVYLPGLGRLVVPSGYDERFAIGHIVESGRHLFVSSGIGTSILPVRFLVPPEITLLTVDSDGP